MAQAAGIDAGHDLRNIAFAWAPILGIPGSSVEAMEALLMSEYTPPETHPQSTPTPCHVT